MMNCTTQGDSILMNKNSFKTSLKLFERLLRENQIIKY